MKILYIVNDVNNAGGVARILSIKTNYLIEKFEFSIDILTQNNGFVSPFYAFNEKINFHDIILKGNIFRFFNAYRKNLNQKIKIINPDIILVCDNGLKAFTIPFILNTNIPIILEVHGSRFVEDFNKKNNFKNRFFSKFKYKFKKYCASKFHKIVVLSQESLKEWNSENAIIIPNPNFFETNEISKLNFKKAIIIARHSYEKGLDRMLPIWKKIVHNHQDWQLDIYGESAGNLEIKNYILQNNIEKNVTLFEPVINIQDKYLEASMYLMTSRQEGFPLVLIEAMAHGLPCIAYDCPVGPKAIINNNENGFLIENGNEVEFAKAIEILIENQNLRLKMGENANKSIQKFNIDAILETWNQLFLNSNNWY